MDLIPTRQLSPELARARTLLAAVIADDELDVLTMADLLGVAIHLDNTYPPPPPLRQPGASADPIGDLTEAAELLGIEADQAATAAEAVRITLALRDLQNVIATLPQR